MARLHRFLFSGGRHAPGNSAAAVAASRWLFATRRQACTRVGGHASIAGLLVLLAACAADVPTGASSHRFTVTVEDGVEVALTTGGPKYDGDIFAYEKVLTIRPDPAVPESYLGSPGAMTMSEDGTIFVGDGRAGRVVAFSLDGAFLQTYGRRGQGPGEFTRPDLLEVIDGTLWAQDRLGLRTHVFSLDGSFLRTVGIPGPPRGFIDGYWWFHTDGRIVVYELGSLRDEKHTYRRDEMRVMDAEGNVLASRETPWLRGTERFQPAETAVASKLAHIASSSSARKASTWGRRRRRAGRSCTAATC